MQVDNRGGQELGEDLGQQAGRILEELYATSAGGIMVVVWLILIARLVVVCAFFLPIVDLRRRMRGNSSRYHGMNLAHRRSIADAESRTK